ncbi:V-set domain-containing T-cell activation inhibitor 1-like [Mugil cephalus]|uniref:V-set domain-containing T-cell activation inhibitor 1-like n=1 Tax=Mugil cephalus TaxID=48193 RepID=UPI001FB6CE72|nr:V-set domain-containing T-cell activation inhibitor 1-like [Mugil cephalus]
MTQIKCVAVLVVLSFQWTLSRGDSEVFCVFAESCVLPCSFQFDSGAVIHWTRAGTEPKSVHSYVSGQDQLTHQDQDQNFRGRTALFEDQISRGNASLLLTGVKVQDEGRYQCYTSSTTGNETSFIDLKMDAPVQEVNIVHAGKRITCSSNGIYPEPELTWSTTPPSNRTFKSSTIVQRAKEQLYNISSSLILPSSNGDLVINCTVSTRRSRETASFLHFSKQLEESTAIAMVFGVILITILTGLVPCICLKCKKHTSVLRQDSYQPDVTWMRRRNSEDRIVFDTETDSHEANHWLLIDSVTTNSSGEIDEV